MTVTQDPHDLHDTWSGQTLTGLPAGSVPSRGSLRRIVRRRHAARNGNATRSGQRRLGHRVRKPPRPAVNLPRTGARWRITVAAFGGILLTICSGMALGVVTWSQSGPRLSFRSEPKGPPSVTGADGVSPGGQPFNVTLTVRNTDSSAFEISAVTADLAALPEECPTTVWRVGTPGLLPTAPARSEVTVPLPVSLHEDAPDSCQGATVRFPVRIDGLRHPRPATGNTTPGDAPTPGHLQATATVTVARLGSPSGAVTARGSRVEVVPGRPAAGPVPTAYDVETLTTDGRPAPICTAVLTSCPDRTAPAAAARRYIVTARLGTHWRRPAPPLTAWTPPPTPTLTLVDGEHRPISTLALTAPAGTSDYTVELHTDGGGTPFHTVRVAAGSSLTRTVVTPRLSPGSHRLVAVARFHGWQVASATLRVETVTDDDATAPSRFGTPAPLPTRFRPAVPAAGPPMATFPPAPTAVPPWVTTSTPGGVRRGPVASTIQGPPEASLPDAPPSSSDPTSTGIPTAVPPASPTASTRATPHGGPPQAVLGARR